MKLTIFTPTYNRAYSLHRLFQSLQSQTDKRFEWLICDDGSTDNTKESAEIFAEEANGFSVKYIYQKHGGKHRAQNLAIRSATGDVFITCDSNKYLADNAVELLLNMFSTIDRSAGICGVGGYRADFSGNVYGGTMAFNTPYLDCTNLERKKYNLGGDKASAFYTDILLRYPFPEYDGEFFISESAWLTPMALDGYKIRWFPEILVYGEYTADGLTKQGANEYRGHYDNFYGHLHVLAMELTAYGIQEKLPDIYEAFDIAKAKGMHMSELSRRVNIPLPSLCLLRLRKLMGSLKRHFLR